MPCLIPVHLGVVFMWSCERWGHSAHPFVPPGHVSDSTGGTAPTGEGHPFTSVDPILPLFSHPITTSPAHPQCPHQSPLNPPHSNNPNALLCPHSSTLYPDPDIQWDSTVTVVASMTVTLLLSAATFWTIKKGEGLGEL